MICKKVIWSFLVKPQASWGFNKMNRPLLFSLTALLLVTISCKFFVGGQKDIQNQMFCIIHSLLIPKKVLFGCSKLFSHMGNLKIEENWKLRNSFETIIWPFFLTLFMFSIFFLSYKSMVDNRKKFNSISIHLGNLLTKQLFQSSQWYFHEC